MRPPTGPADCSRRRGRLQPAVAEATLALPHLPPPSSGNWLDQRRERSACLRFSRRRTRKASVELLNFGLRHALFAPGVWCGRGGKSSVRLLNFSVPQLARGSRASVLVRGRAADRRSHPRSIGDTSRSALLRGSAPVPSGRRTTVSRSPGWSAAVRRGRVRERWRSPTRVSTNVPRESWGLWGEDLRATRRDFPGRRGGAGVCEGLRREPKDP